MKEKGREENVKKERGKRLEKMGRWEKERGEERGGEEKSMFINHGRKKKDAFKLGKDITEHHECSCFEHFLCT